MVSTNEIMKVLNRERLSATFETEAVSISFSSAVYEKKFSGRDFQWR